MVNPRLSVPSPVEMDLQVWFGAKADTGTAIVGVVATEPITYTGLHLYVAVIENDLFYGQPRHQVLRQYEPSWTGIPFTIAQGDTFTHSEKFPIKAAWNAENCKIVAFVQDDSTTYDVLQSIQSPVIVPTPELVGDLTASKEESDIHLNWSPVTEDTQGNPLTVDHYNVYRSTLGFFDPGSDPFTTTTNTFYVDDSGVVGDTGTQYFYWVTAMAGYKESGESIGVGEFDLQMVVGK